MLTVIFFYKGSLDINSLSSDSIISTHSLVYNPVLDYDSERNQLVDENERLIGAKCAYKAEIIDLTEKISQKEDFIKKIRQEQNVPDKG